MNLSNDFKNRMKILGGIFNENLNISKKWSFDKEKDNFDDSRIFGNAEMNKYQIFYFSKNKDYNINEPVLILTAGHIKTDIDKTIYLPGKDNIPIIIKRWKDLGYLKDSDDKEKEKEDAIKLEMYVLFLLQFKKISFTFKNLPKSLSKLLDAFKGKGEKENIDSNISEFISTYYNKEYKF